MQALPSRPSEHRPKQKQYQRKTLSTLGWAHELSVLLPNLYQVTDTVHRQNLSYDLLNLIINNQVTTGYNKEMSENISF